MVCALMRIAVEVHNFFAVHGHDLVRILSLSGLDYTTYEMESRSRERSGGRRGSLEGVAAFNSEHVTYYIYCTIICITAAPHQEYIHTLATRALQSLHVSRTYTN